jgi:hypothetical protein
VRKVVKLIRKSLKNDIYLQNNVKDQFEGESSLELNFKTRRSSLHNVVERFLKPKTCVS